MRRAAAFTLVELLVVIGIIALLLSVLVPVVGRARAQGLDAQCKSNLRQLHQGVLIYANDNGRRMPGINYDVPAQSWQAAVEATLRTPEAKRLQCPAADEDVFATLGGKPGFSYGINTHVMTPVWDRRIDQRVPATDGADGLRRSVPIAEVILLGDKGVGEDGLLRTDDGFLYVRDDDNPDPYARETWDRYMQHGTHAAARSYRHGRGKSAHVNVALMDGSVGPLGGHDMQMQLDLDGDGLTGDATNGRWIFGPAPQWVRSTGATCCP